MNGSQKTALVTGGATGIGLASAVAFSKAGYNVVLTDLELADAQAAASGIDGPILAAKLDVCDQISIKSAFIEAEKKFGRVDVLHANAGVSSMKRALDLTEDDWDFNFDVNAKGVFLSNQVAIRHFLSHQNQGVIVNTASLAAKVGAPFLAHYSASKFVVLGWTQSLAREHAKDGIRVNAVCPGFVKTGMQEREIQWEAELLNSTPSAVVQSYIDLTPIGRLETAEEVADVVIFLASDKARFMTGQGINVTGGVYMG